MNNFLTFLGEAFPPPKKAGPPEGAQRSPFGNSSGPKKPKSTFGDQGTPPKPGNAGKKPPFGPKAPPKDDGDEKPSSFGQPEQAGATGPQGAFGAQQPQSPEMLMAMQQAEQEAAEQEAELERQRAEKEAMERQRVKNLRAQADADVMSALEDKYNDDTDYVEFYPDMLTFSQFNDEQKEKEAKLRGKKPTGPGAEPMPASTEKSVGDQGEIPKVPDSEKTALKGKKIRGNESDDTESLSQPPVSDDEKDQSGLDKEKSVAQGAPDPDRQRIFKIKSADHISGSKFVGEDEMEQELDSEEDEDGLEAPGKEAKPKAKPFDKGESDEDDDSFEEKGKRLKKDKAKDPTIKKFSESGWQGQ